MHRRSALGFRALAHPPGPHSGGGWTVAYVSSGSNSFNGSPVVPWQSGAKGGSAGVGSSSSTSVFAEDSGSVTAQFAWSGSDRPKVSWLAVRLVATWRSDHGSGTAANGLDDPLKNDGAGTGGTSSGIRVFRVTGSTFAATVGGLNAYATVTSSTGALMGATATVDVTGFVASKSASLARPDGGDLTVADVAGTATALPQNRSVANTLRSWDDSDGVSPGPNGQSLTGTYGGTWSKLPDGTTDNVILNWGGASCGAYTLGPISGLDHHTTPYAGVGQSRATMPLADGSGTPRTQDWKYSVQDQGDGTQLDLTCHWVCQYAYRALETNRLPPLYERAARAFLAKPGFSALRPKTLY